jgi:hypothetical protein
MEQAIAVPRHLSNGDHGGGGGGCRKRRRRHGGSVGGLSLLLVAVDPPKHGRGWNLIPLPQLEFLLPEPGNSLIPMLQKPMLVQVGRRIPGWEAMGGCGGSPIGEGVAVRIRTPQPPSAVGGSGDGFRCLRGGVNMGSSRGFGKGCRGIRDGKTFHHQELRCDDVSPYQAVVEVVAGVSHLRPWMKVL